MVKQTCVKDAEVFQTFWKEEEAEKFKDEKGEVKSEYVKQCCDKFCEKYGLEMNGKKKNVLWIAGDSEGCFYVRCLQPAMAINKYSKKYNAIVSNKITIELLSVADIVIWQRTCKPKFFKFMLAARQAGKINVYEVDDLLHELSPDNPAYFEINPTTDDFYNAMKFIDGCDKMIVSTENIKEYYKEAINADCEVIGNSINTNKSPVFPVKIESDRVRIVWAGGTSHIKDLAVLKAVFKELKKEFGKKIKITMIGIDGVLDLAIGEKEFTNEAGEKEKGKVYQHIDLALKYDKFIKGFSIDDYLDKFIGMNFDIGLCPLTESAFNQAKSPLKWMEYSLAGIATIATDIEPYNKAIKNGETGLLVENTTEAWVDAIKNLIADKNKRLKLAKNAWKKVTEDYDINNNWIEYETLFDNLIKERNDKKH